MRRASGFKVKSRPEMAGQTHQRHFRKPVTLGGQRRSDDRARQVFGDGMHRSLYAVNQGDLSGERVGVHCPSCGYEEPAGQESEHP